MVWQLAIWHGLSPVSVFFAFFFVELKCDTCTILFSQPTCVRVDCRTPFALVPLDAARTDFPSFVIGTIRSSEWNVKIALYHSNWSVPGALVGEITDSVKHSDSTAMIQFQSFTAVQYYWLVQLIHPGLSWQSERSSPSHCCTCATIFHILGARENGHCGAGWVDSGEGRWQHPTYPRHPCGRVLHAHWRLEWVVHRDLKSRVLSRVCRGQ